VKIPFNEKKKKKKRGRRKWREQGNLGLSISPRILAMSASAVPSSFFAALIFLTVSILDLPVSMNPPVNAPFLLTWSPVRK